MTDLIQKIHTIKASLIIGFNTNHQAADNDGLQKIEGINQNTCSPDSRESKNKKL